MGLETIHTRTHTHTHTHLTLLLQSPLHTQASQPCFLLTLNHWQLISQKMQPLHWSFLFYGLSSTWNRRKIKLSNIFNQEIIKWWWINWLSSSLCVCLWGVQQIQSLLVFLCFHALNDVFHLSFAQVEEWSVCCSLAASYCLHLGNKLSVCFYYSVVWMCVREWVGWFHIHCALSSFSFLLSCSAWTGLTQLDRVRSEWDLCVWQLLYAVSCTGSPALR